MLDSSPPGTKSPSIFTRLLLFIALGLAIDFILSLLLLRFFSGVSAQAMRGMQFIAVSCVYLLPAWLFAHSIGRDPLEFLKIRTYPKLGYFMIALLLLIICEPFVSFTGALNEKMQMPESLYWLEHAMKNSEKEAARLTDLLLKDHSPPGLLANLTVMAVLTAIGEEVLFRGLFQQLLIRWSRSIHAGIWIAAFIFSFFHFQFYGFLPRLFLGAVLGYLFVSSRSLWTSIFFHMVNNTIVILIRYFDFEKKGEGIFSESYEFPVLIVVLSAALTAGILIGLHKQNRKHGNGLGESI